MPVSTNTRKGLGRRYGVDPALLMAQQELENRYALVPGQEARTLERERMTQQIEAQNAQGTQAGLSGLVGAGGNLAGMYMMSQAYQGKPLLGATVDKWMGGTGQPKTGFGTSTVADPSKGLTTGEAALAGGSAGGLSVNAAGTSIAGMDQVPTWASNQAALDASIAAVNPVASPAFGLGAAGMAAGAGYLGGMVGQPLGEAIGVGGQRERGAVGGALAGAAVGSQYGAVAGLPGMAVGAVIGGVVGLVSGKGTWICTATNKHVGTSKEQKSSMKKLRRYAKENFPGWLEFYNVNGPNLIMEIEDQEADLVLFYNIVKRTLVEPCVALVDKGDLKGAFDLYKKKTEELFKEYAPDIEVKEVF